MRIALEGCREHVWGEYVLVTWREVSFRVGCFQLSTSTQAIVRVQSAEHVEPTQCIECGRWVWSALVFVRREGGARWAQYGLGADGVVLGSGGTESSEQRRRSIGHVAFDDSASVDTGILAMWRGSKPRPDAKGRARLLRVHAPSHVRP